MELKIRFTNSHPLFANFFKVWHAGIRYSAAAAAAATAAVVVVVVVASVRTMEDGMGRGMARGMGRGMDVRST